METALTLPLVLFCVLGALQLCILLHARLIAEYAVYRAVRAGSLAHGDCDAMTQAAVLSVLPAVTRTNDGAALERAFNDYRFNRYKYGGHTGQIVELWREQPKAKDVDTPEDLSFDQPGHLMRLEARMVFWKRLDIPLADWVMTRAFLAYWGLEPYRSVNPLAPTETADWSPESQPPRWPGGDLGDQMRAWADEGHYLFPVQTNFGMRMMTPAQKKYWQGVQGCRL